MSTVDLTPIIQPIVQIIGLVIGAFIASYTPRAIVAFETYTHVKLTDQQRAIVSGAINTAKGNVETLLDQKALSVADVKVSNPTIAALANAALASVPNATNALGVTPETAAKMIVGATNTSVFGVAPAPVTPLSIVGKPIV